MICQKNNHRIEKLKSIGGKVSLKPQMTNNARNTSSFEKLAEGDMVVEEFLSTLI